MRTFEVPSKNSFFSDSMLMLEKWNYSESKPEKAFQHFSEGQMIFVFTQYVERNHITSDSKLMEFIEIFNWAIFDYHAVKNFFEFLTASELKWETSSKIHQHFFGIELLTTKRKREKMKRKIEFISRRNVSSLSLEEIKVPVWVNALSTES